jgi:Zn-dependent protease
VAFLPGTKIMSINLLAESPIRYVQEIAIVIVSICLHELAHGVAALSQGDDTPRRTGHMTLDPLVHMGWESILFLCIGGIAWGAMPVNPAKFRSRQWGDVLVSAAGPLSNLALGCMSIALLAISLRVQFFSAEFFHLAARINLTLCFFNCLPIPQLDGFHIFSKFFPELKILDSPNHSLFVLMIFLVSGLGASLYAVSDLIIQAAIGSELLNS